MGVKVYVVVPVVESTWLSDYATLGDATSDLRKLWNEDEGPQVFVVIGDSGHCLATLMRDQSDHEVCYTTYCDGSMDRHRCHYALDAEGHYQGTEITRLNEDNEPEGPALLVPFGWESVAL